MSHYIKMNYSSSQVHVKLKDEIRAQKIIFPIRWFDRLVIAGDDKFIYWLRDCREAGLQVSLGQVKAKVTEILSSHGQADVEKTCKWFLLWHNRYRE